MNARGKTIRLATRGSALALRQAAAIQETLADRRYDVDLVEVTTTGDQIRDELIYRLGKTGAFVRNLDELVLDGSVEAAVHSMKDVPTEQPDELVVAGVPQRVDPSDVLVTPVGSTLSELPEGATVGTSSLRRKAELLAERADLSVEPLRGNVDTRVEKLLAPSLQDEHGVRSEAETEREDRSDADDYVFPYDQSVDSWFNTLTEIERRALEREVDTEFDAIVLARAGLERSGLLYAVETAPLPTETFVPAPGQGALAVTTLEGPMAAELNGVLDHPRSRVETTVERTILAELGGGCVAPLGIHAVLQGRVVRTTVRVLSRDGTDEVSASRDLPVEQHIGSARDFAADLASRGATELIEEATRATAVSSGESRDEGTETGTADADAASAVETVDPSPNAPDVEPDAESPSDPGSEEPE